MRVRLPDDNFHDVLDILSKLSVLNIAHNVSRQEVSGRTYLVVEFDIVDGVRPARI